MGLNWNVSLAFLHGYPASGWRWLDRKQQPIPFIPGLDEREKIILNLVIISENWMVGPFFAKNCQSSSVPPQRIGWKSRDYRFETSHVTTLSHCVPQQFLSANHRCVMVSNYSFFEYALPQLSIRKRSHVLFNDIPWSMNYLQTSRFCVWLPDWSGTWIASAPRRGETIDRRVSLGWFTCVSGGSSYIFCLACLVSWRFFVIFLGLSDNGLELRNRWKRHPNIVEMACCDHFRALIDFPR